MSALEEYAEFKANVKPLDDPIQEAFEVYADAAIAELEAENKQLRRDDEMLRRALTNFGSWEVDDILARYPAAKREGGEG